MYIQIKYLLRYLTNERGKGVESSYLKYSLGQKEKSRENRKGNKYQEGQMKIEKVISPSSC